MLYEEIPTLSVATAVNVTVWVCELVVSVTDVSLAPNEDTLGAWLSVFVTVTLREEVDVFPAASEKDAVTDCVTEPKEYDP
jgi:hypothetical protein